MRQRAQQWSSRAQVWLKDQDDASEKILNASATAMRHHVNTQASLSYDVDTNNRQIALANEFAAKYAATFQPASAAGSSSSAGGAAGSGKGGDGVASASSMLGIAPASIVGGSSASAMMGASAPGRLLTS